MGIITFPTTAHSDITLGEFFSWAGSVFPYNGTAANITITGSTTWTASTSFQQVGKLTINSGQTLKINTSPFYIFADEINFGDASSIIDASGLDGSSAITTFPSTMAAGGTATASGSIAQGGGGGGMLFILCNRITGANGVIKANGGNAYKNATFTGTQQSAGRGALSTTINNAVASENFHFSLYGVSNYFAVFTTDIIINSTQKLLGSGGVISTLAGTGGGSGGSDSGTFFVGGGSGIGGGGSVRSATAGASGTASTLTLNPPNLIYLANSKCLGGGGGAAQVRAGGGANDAGGGGGGSIVVWTHTQTATPTLQANGGTGLPTSGTADGGAGVTYLLVI